MKDPMTRKPDRWERMVKKAMRELARCECVGTERNNHIEALIEHAIRREHRAVVRMVKRVGVWQADQKGLAGDMDAIDIILDRLHKRAS